MRFSKYLVHHWYILYHKNIKDIKKSYIYDIFGVKR